jgi:hypothetical protein
MNDNFIFIGDQEETKIFKDASLYMVRYLASKYTDYVSKKKRIMKSGKVTNRDSMVSKFYDTEIQMVKYYKPSLVRLDWKASEKFVNKIIKSKTWKKLCDNTEGCDNKSHANPRMVQQKMRWAGMATYDGQLILRETNCPYTIVHELAHLCGNMHHDIGFRRDVLILASRFISPVFAKILKKDFKDAGFKIKTSTSIKTPTSWLESYNKMALMRAKRDV